MREYLELTKPRITWLILMSTGVGYFFGLDRSAAFSWALLIHTIVGTALIASGTAALNQWWERDSDALDEAHRGPSSANGADEREERALVRNCARRCLALSSSRSG